MSLKLVKRPKTPNWIMRGSVRGKSIEETTGTADKKIAEAIRINREKELLEESVWGKQINVNFAEAALDYLEHGGGEQRFIKPLHDHFGTQLLRNIGQHAIDLAAKKILPSAAPATLNRQIYTPMSAILRHASKKGWCPVPNLERPKQPKGKIVWLKVEEAERLIDACADHIRPLVIFMLYTGGRAGEVVWLDWSNVNLDMKQVTFPKTKNGEARSVPLHQRVIEQLLLMSRREGPVFVTHRGLPYMRPDPVQDADTSAGTRISSAFRSACKRAGLGRISPGKTLRKTEFKTSVTPHVCRHTWATWHYQTNRDLTTLQQLGGWKSVNMVMRYAHTNVELHSESIEALPWGNSGERIISVSNNAISQRRTL